MAHRGESKDHEPRPKKKVKRSRKGSWYVLCDVQGSDVEFMLWFTPSPTLPLVGMMSAGGVATSVSS
jgi:hypothetical protein